MIRTLTAPRVKTSTSQLTPAAKRRLRELTIRRRREMGIDIADQGPVHVSVPLRQVLERLGIDLP